MTSSDTTADKAKRLLGPWVFPLCMAGLYGLGLFLDPDSTRRAMDVVVSMSGQLAFPLCFALLIMVLVNRIVSPATVSRFLGKGAGLRGILLSSLAGVLSMGPIYAWYPIFKTVQEGGASNLIVANFIGCRSVKPMLFPVLVAYFGWGFSVAFLAASLIGAFLVACVVNAVCPGSGSGRDPDDPSA